MQQASSLIRQQFAKWSLLLTILWLSPNLFADPVEQRAKSVAKTSPADIEAQTLRFKIIRSRALLLHLTDLLPERGNPYAHGAEFAQKSTLAAFNSAQQVQQQMNDVIWRPEIVSGQTVDEPLKAIFVYWARFAQTVAVLDNLVYPKLNQSVVVGPISGLTSLATSQQWERTSSLLVYMRQQAEVIFKDPELSQDIRDLLDCEKRKVVLAMISTYAAEIEKLRRYIETPANSAVLGTYLGTLQSLAIPTDAQTLIQHSQSRLQSIDPKRHPQYQVVDRAFSGVDLPDSGDIDGSAHQFEIVTRLEVGYEIIQALIAEVMKW